MIYVVQQLKFNSLKHLILLKLPENNANDSDSDLGDSRIGHNTSPPGGHGGRG
jgi:hypothetical protein